MSEWQNNDLGYLNSTNALLKIIIKKQRAPMMAFIHLPTLAPPHLPPSVL
jgi:hypothetical protein